MLRKVVNISIRIMNKDMNKWFIKEIQMVISIWKWWKLRCVCYLSEWRQFEKSIYLVCCSWECLVWAAALEGSLSVYIKRLKICPLTHPFPKTTVRWKFVYGVIYLSVVCSGKIWKMYDEVSVGTITLDTVQH